MSKIAVGSEVEAYCTKCRLVLAHTIVSMDGTKPKRVQCNTCDGEHNYRAKKPAKKTTAAKKEKTTRGASKKSRQSWEEVMKEAADKPHKQYSMAGSFNEGDWIEHGTFGLGCVQSFIAPNKITVRFADSTRMLVCNYSQVKTVVSNPGSLLDTLQLLVPGASKRTLRQMLVQQRIRINGQVCRKAAHRIQAGDTIEIGPRKNPPVLPPGLDILFEDKAIIIVQKPFGMLTVSTPDERERTVYAHLRRYLKELNPRQDLYIVHRLDRFASGLLVFAKTEDIQLQLKELFSRHDIRRMYWAVVSGSIEQESGTIRSHLAENRAFHMYSVKDRKLGKPAVTHYRVLRRFPDVTTLEVTLETGRKNQIRAHLSEIGHPVAGDRAYGSEADPIGRLALHAFHLGFTHPALGTPVEFTTEPPPEFLAYLPKAMTSIKAHRRGAKNAEVRRKNNS